MMMMMKIMMKIMMMMKMVMMMMLMKIMMMKIDKKNKGRKSLKFIQIKCESSARTQNPEPGSGSV